MVRANVRMKLLYVNLNIVVGATLKRKGKRRKVVFLDICTNAKSGPFPLSIFWAYMKRNAVAWDSTLEEQTKTNDIKNKMYYTIKQ